MEGGKNFALNCFDYGMGTRVPVLQPKELKNWVFLYTNRNFSNAEKCFDLMKRSASDCNMIVH